MITTSVSLLLILMGLTLPVAAALGIMAYVLQAKYAFIPATGVIGELAWNSSSDFILVAAPMFIMMGELMHRSGISEKLFVALTPWFSRVPGRLMHANIAASAIFAATSGSSVATAATIGTVAIPNMDKGGYNRPLFLGSIAAGGTLGILIPPSINMIIYAVLTNTSVADLYAAGFIPGFMMAGLFSLMILSLALYRPTWAGPKVDASSLWDERISGLRHLIPPLFLFIIVVGSIYAGIATPTEAAAVGLMATILLVALNGQLNLPVLLRAFEGTIRTTCMVMIIVIAAFFLNYVMVSIGLVKAITDLVLSLGWPPFAMLIAIIVFYLILGCFMETLSMMIATTPIVVPVIVKLGYSPIWWGIIFVILMEAALVTPPVGLNLYVVQAVRGKGKFSDLCVGIVPYALVMLLTIAILIAFPQIALWLPSVLNPNGG